MTTEQKELLLQLVRTKGEDTTMDFDERMKWMEIYWQVVKIETEEN